jgi:cytochrome c553
MFGKLAIFGAMVLLFAAGARAETIEEKAQVCAGGHSENGKPVDKTILTIWGQQTGYLYIQLRDFKRGDRKNEIMQPIASTFERDDMLAIAEYFLRKPWPDLSEPNIGEIYRRTVRKKVRTGIGNVRAVDVVGLEAFVDLADARHVGRCDGWLVGQSPRTCECDQQYRQQESLRSGAHPMDLARKNSLCIPGHHPSFGAAHLPGPPSHPIRTSGQVLDYGPVPRLSIGALQLVMSCRMPTRKLS